VNIVGSPREWQLRVNDPATADAEIAKVRKHQFEREHGN
jgi:hypothetical protein